MIDGLKNANSIPNHALTDFLILIFRPQILSIGFKSKKFYIKIKPADEVFHIKLF